MSPIIPPEGSNVIDDWVLVTMVIDRILFIVYAVIMFVMSCAALARYEQGEF